MHREVIQSSLLSEILVSAFSRSARLISLGFGFLQKILRKFYCQKLFEDYQLVTIHGLCLHISILWVPNTVSTFMLNTKMLKLNILLHIGLARLLVTIAIGESLQVSSILDVTLMLMNLEKGLTKSTALLKNCVWKNVLEFFLTFLVEYGNSLFLRA